MPLPSDPVAVVFDFDGVIADSLGLFYDVYKKTCDHFGLHLPVTSAAAFRVWYNARWEQNFLDMGVSSDDIGAVLAYAGKLADYHNVPLFPDVVDTVRRLAPQYRLGIASTTYASVIRAKLAQEGLGDLFSVVVGGEGGGSDKITRYGDALRGLEADGPRSVGVGDTPLDVHCARHWGMRTVGVTFGWNDAALLEEAAPDRLVHQPRDVEAAILSLLAPRVASA